MTTNMESSSFSLDDYDCIGFDLDCTLAEYNVKELVKLVYDLLVKYLVEKKSYESEMLLKPFDEQEYFLQKGLFMDLKKGNVLKVDENGVIIKATHGTNCLSEEKIVDYYGPNKRLEVFDEILKDPLAVWNSAHENAVRATLDCFDMACTLIFARLVDDLDKRNNGVLNKYEIWPDILSGLYQLYSKNHFASGESDFFAELRKNPSLYYKKWSPEKLEWLKEIKSKKFVYVLTGSFIDFASWTASYCIGENWKEYFDVVLCYARKPFFFNTQRPFLTVPEESETVKESDLAVNMVYSQGNWKELSGFISKQTKKEQPKCVYIGDNIIQDVYSPVRFECCDAVAVSIELKDGFKTTSFWGSYFDSPDKRVSYWNRLIKTYAKIAVSSLDVFVNKEIEFRYSCLTNSKAIDLDESNGYYTN